MLQRASPSRHSQKRDSYLFHSYRVIAQSIEVRGVSPSEELTRGVEQLLGDNSVFIEY